MFFDLWGLLLLRFESFGDYYLWGQLLGACITEGGVNDANDPKIFGPTGAAASSYSI